MRRKQTLNAIQPTNSCSGLVPESLEAAVLVLCKSLMLVIGNVLNILIINPLNPNDPCRGRTAPLTSKRRILYVYSTNIGTECFKHGI
jgi:hypothetical protein